MWSHAYPNDTSKRKYCITLSSVFKILAWCLSFNSKLYIRLQIIKHILPKQVIILYNTTVYYSFQSIALSLIKRYTRLQIIKHLPNQSSFYVLPGMTAYCSCGLLIAEVFLTLANNETLSLCVAGNSILITLYKFCSDLHPVLGPDGQFYTSHLLLELDGS